MVSPFFSPTHVVALLLSLSLLLTSNAAASSDDRGVSLVDQYRDSRKRIALVIGNGSYKSSPLRNPVNDAKVVGL